MTTIRKVAELCGVAPMTVSHVLNNKAGKVSPETRARVLRVVREMDYRPSARGRSDPRQAVNTLGIVSGLAADPSLVWSYYNYVLNGVLSGAFRERQNVTLFTDLLLWSDTPRAIRTYCDGRCDGLILIAPQDGDTLAEALRERGFPFVSVGGTMAAGDSGVDVDNLAATREAVGHLLTRGHRRIALLKGPEAHETVRERERGYRETLAAWGLTPDESLILPGDYTEESAGARTRLLLARPLSERPTAFFCGNDEIALGACRAAQALGHRVPEDVSIIGFDDSPEAIETNPPLTTVRQPYRQIGEQSVEMLLALVRGQASVPYRTLLPGELIMRESVRNL